METWWVSGGGRAAAGRGQVWEVAGPCLKGPWGLWSYVRGSWRVQARSWGSYRMVLAVGSKGSHRKVWPGRGLLDGWGKGLGFGDSQSYD